MASDSSGLKIDGQYYELPFEDALENLTGKESRMLEDYLGGWGNLRFDEVNTRSVVVMVWLAKHHAGEPVTLEQVEEMKGLLFGGTVEDIDVRPPDGGTASSAETTEGSGLPGSPAATSATA